MADNFELYRTAVFLIGQGGVDWQKDFAVITAYNPDGMEPSEDAAEALRLNRAAHLQLKRDIELLAKPWWLPTFLLSAFYFVTASPRSRAAPPI